MLFNSFGFVLLVLVTFLLYYLPFLKRFQKLIVIIASFIFYSYAQPILLLLLIISICVNIVASYYVYHSVGSQRKLYAILGVVVNLGILAFFKYSPLFGKTLFSEEIPLIGSVLVNDYRSVGEFLISIPLPVGISFFTFQGISLVVDAFRADHVKEYQGIVPKSFKEHAINTTLFKAFFPQLVAGPIVKAHEFMYQIEPKKIGDIDWGYCFHYLVVGYFLKMVVADNLKDQTFWIAYPYFEGQSSITLITMLFAYSMQIFADFAGYSLIALGLSRLFGYKLIENFNFPYISRSFSEFWRRWHISLSTFLKEYLYIPLGGNRKGNVRTYINLFIVMFLGGLWHGAAWSYAVWGSFHGLALGVERFLTKRIKMPKSVASSAIQMIVVFSFVTFAWLLFKLPDFTYAIEYVKSMFKNTDIPIEGGSYAIILYSLLYSIPVVAYHIHYLYQENKQVNGLERKPVLGNFQFAAYGIMLFLLITNSGSANDFIYFQF